MGCCCTKVYRYCSPIGVCDEGEFATGFNAPADDTYSLIVDFLGVEYTIKAEILSGEELVFPTKDLNESYIFRARIEKADGTQMTFIKDLIEYDCLEFQTIIKYEIV